MSYQNHVSSESEPLLISEGKWSETISWQFFASQIMPDLDLCTAVCCLVEFDSKIILVNNKRGWELPAGKIEDGETPSQAVIREVLEETRLSIADPKIFGYKKITASQPVPLPNKPDSFYPFPTSYVVFFYAVAHVFAEKLLADDVTETKQVVYSEALELLAASTQYVGILEYLFQDRDNKK